MSSYSTCSPSQQRGFRASDSAHSLSNSCSCRRATAGSCITNTFSAFFGCHSGLEHYLWPLNNGK
jgi:hypothetical protein